MAEQPQKTSPTRVTPVLKAQCIQETLDCGNAAAVARRHHLPPERVRAWVREASKHPRMTTLPEVTQLEADCLGNQVFRTLAEAYNAVAQWITFYNDRRMHGSLDDWPPAVFYRWVLAGTAPTIKAVHC